jgi:hypothetical protein
LIEIEILVIQDLQPIQPTRALILDAITGGELCKHHSKDVTRRTNVVFSAQGTRFMCGTSDRTKYVTMFLPNAIEVRYPVTEENFVKKEKWPPAGEKHARRSRRGGRRRNPKRHWQRKESVESSVE